MAPAAVVVALLFAVVLRDGEKVARLRRAGERHEIDLIATKRADKP